MSSKFIKIKAPKFEMYQAVILYWNDKEYKGSITRQHYATHDDSWSYEIRRGADGKRFPEDAFEAIALLSQEES